MMETKTFAVQGMVCDACAGHVTRALTALGGVQAATVDLAAASATVIYDPTAVSFSQMREAVEDEGYEVQD